MRWLPLVVLASLVAARADAGPIRCEDMATADFQIDGLLDDWPKASAVRIGAAPDGAFTLRCAWDGTALALSLDVEDDRVVRVTGRGHEDHVEISVAAGGAPTKLDVFPGNAIAKPRRKLPARVVAGDSLQPKGFSIEARIPAAAIAGFSASTPVLELAIVFHDSDQAAGGDDADIPFAGTIELGDKKDLLDDFLKATRLKRAELVVDTMVDLDPDRRGKERLVAGRSVIGVLTDQFAFVTVAGEIAKVATLPIGPKGAQIVSALVRQQPDPKAQATRELLMLWTVWSGQLQPLAQIEVRRERGKSVLESTWKVVGKELVVEPKPAVGFTAATWAEEPATDADPILLPWDKARKGIAYAVTGAEIVRRDLKRRQAPRRWGAQRRRRRRAGN